MVGAVGDTKLNALWNMCFSKPPQFGNRGAAPDNVLVKIFFNLIFQRGFLPLIQRATRVTRTTATAIDHIITDAILESTWNHKSKHI